VDHLGAPQKMTTASGNLAWTIDYEPFGNVLSSTAALRNSLRFPGQYFDAETGLHYNYFRDYDPSIGRYVETDPIGLVGGLGRYVYVGANPLGFTDPLGLAKITLTFGGALFSFEAGGTKESGVAFDTEGNLCFIVVNCENKFTIGPGFAALGGSAGIDKGTFCEGTNISNSERVMVDLGLGGVGAISATTDGEGRLTGGGKAFGGIGAGLGVGSLACEERTFCLNPLGLARRIRD
jgi:RHS repeat-associated protein